MSPFLVTGGCGFIGSHLVEYLAGEGYPVRVLDDLSTGREENLQGVRGKVELLQGSVTDPRVVAQAFRGCALVFHLAALPSVQRSFEDPLASHAACATGTLHVLMEARREGIRRVVYAASSSAYGDSPGAVRTEGMPTIPLSPYAAAKLAGEHYCRCFTRAYGLETVRLRLFNVFGPRQRGDSPYAGVVARFVTALCQGEAPTLFGDGLQTRDFTFVGDAVQAMLLAAEAPGVAGKVYNVGTGRGTTVLEVLHQLGELLGVEARLEQRPPRPGDVILSRADITLAKHDLGYEPHTSLIEGLRRTLEAHRAS